MTVVGAVAACRGDPSFVMSFRVINQLDVPVVLRFGGSPADPAITAAFAIDGADVTWITLPVDRWYGSVSVFSAACEELSRLDIDARRGTLGIEADGDLVLLAEMPPLPTFSAARDAPSTDRCPKVEIDAS